MDACRLHATAALLVMCAPAAVLAQTAESPKGHRPLFSAGALYDSRTRGTVEAGVLIPFSVGFADQDAVLGEAVGLSVTAGLGPGGRRYAIGPAAQINDGGSHFLFGGMDALATFVHTTHAPRAARPDTKYVGGEVGFTVMYVRVAIGFAHAVSGPDPHRTGVTWNVGFRTVW